MTRIIETSFGEVKLETTVEKNYLDCYIGDNYDEYVGSIEGTIGMSEVTLCKRVENIL